MGNAIISANAADPTEPIAFLAESDAPGTILLRVRYVECDPMKVAHHSAYLAWMEMARTELFRRCGIAYRDMETCGQFMVVARLSIRYRQPARYDDILAIHCHTRVCRRAKLEHIYEIRRDGQLLATAETTLVCIDREGQPQPIPEKLCHQPALNQSLHCF